MIQLPFKCSASELTVHPKNWNTARASMKKDWYIFYRFYDPAYRDTSKYKHGKLVVLKGMKKIGLLSDRQEIAKRLIAQEKLKLQSGYNPITGRTVLEGAIKFEVEPFTPFIEALNLTAKRLTVSPSTKRDIRNTISLISRAANQLGYSEVPVTAIGRKHLKQLLLHVDLTNGESAHRYNRLRSYLMILYKEMIEMEVVEVNLLRDISKKKTIHRLRKLPSIETRQKIDTYLKEHQYRLWLFTHIFFHSGARLTEMMQIKMKDVDLNRQTFMVTIKKGTYYKETLKQIKDIALPFWQEAVLNAADEDYIFSKGLIPGKEAIQSFQITKRWNLHIKKKLGINDDFYSLKHLNLDEIATILDINAAASMASHTSTAVTLKHYAVNESQRSNERLKQLQNKFA
jgi:site-specific recombinase XerC